MQRKGMTLAALAASAVLATGAGWKAAAAEVPQDPKAPIIIWADGNRSAQANAYKAAHPDVDIKVEVIGSAQGEITSKVGLAVKAGNGIPDVVFLNKPDEISTLSANPINFPLALNDLVSKDIIDGFPSLGRCTYDGKIYCLANDTGQTVLWYNKAQFDEWGYQVPKTFDEFKVLGDKLVAEHPGYNLGSISGRYGVDAFFGSSGCPVLAAVSVTETRINLADPKCTRVGDVLGPMIANGSLSTLDLYDKNYTIHVAKGETVAMVGASWVADFAFKPMTTNSGTDFDAKGKFAAAPMPLWNGETTNWSGAVGGGLWVVSARTKNRVEAVKALLGMTTDPSLVKTQTTYPAYIPNAKAWLAIKATDPWYAEDPSAVLTDALTKVNPADAYTRYQTQALDSFNKTVIAYGATDMAKALAEWGKQTTQAAESVGYTVIKK